MKQIYPSPRAEGSIAAAAQRPGTTTSSTSESPGTSRSLQPVTFSQVFADTPAQGLRSVGAGK